MRAAMSSPQHALERPGPDSLFERLAAIEHDRWSDWQRYVHSLVIPADLVQDGDRREVRRYWPLIEPLMVAARDE